MKPDLFLTPSEVRKLRHMTRRSVGRVALRALMVLWRAEGIPMVEIANRLSLHRDTVTVWIERYRSLGIAGLEDEASGQVLEPSEEEEKSEDPSPGLMSRSAAPAAAPASFPPVITVMPG